MESRSRFGGTGAFERLSTVGIVGTVAFVALSVFAAIAGGEEMEKVFVVSWVAFLAMAGGAWLGARASTTDAHRLVWGYGLASGAMIASAAMFLVPQAIGLGGERPQIGGIGIAFGIVAGYSAHTIGHRLTHLDLSVDVTTAEISAHALSAGVIIGLVYGTLPELGLLLGLSIVSHKGPAGYAAARRLSRSGASATPLLLPAAGVGVTAIPSAMLTLPSSPVVEALVFGFAAGIFLHVAMDFLPHCETGSEIDEVCSIGEDSHGLLDELRTHAVASTVLGGVAVALAWALVGGPLAA